MPTHYVQFATADGQTVLVEADVAEVAPQGGVVKAGIAGKLKDSIALAGETFDGAMRRAITCNARAVIDAVQGLPKPPGEIEVSFGLKVTGEAGNIAVGKAGGDVNFQVKLAWKQL